MVTETFRPVWNRAIDGFGNKDPGRRRATQYESPWDVLHPGRKFAEKLASSGLGAEFFIQRIDDYFAGRPLAKLPKVIAEQIEEEHETGD
ncbi:MAG: Eco29kI family restriction endonuclease [Novosphingobium sp.]